MHDIVSTLHHSNSHGAGKSAGSSLPIQFLACGLGFATADPDSLNFEHPSKSKMHWDAEPYLEPAAKAEGITAPHFDDETTLLSARPVVPLAEIGSRSRLRLWFSAALASLLIAVAAGALIQLGRGRQESSPALSSAVDSASPLPIETEADKAPRPTANGSVSSVEPNNPSEEDPASKAVEKKKELPINTRVPATIANMDNHKDGRDDRIRRQLRREARRLDRQAKRAAAGNPTDAVDGIFRIQDIFEGSRRP